MNGILTLYLIMAFYVFLILGFFPGYSYFIIKKTSIFAIERAMVAGIIISLILYIVVGRKMVLDADEN